MTRNHFARRIIGGLMLIGGLTAVGVASLYPDLLGVIWTRSQFSYKDRMIDFSQYHQTVRIGSDASSDRENGRPTAVATVQTRHATSLLRMAEQTSSNIVVMNQRGDLLLEAYHARANADSSMLTNSMSMAKTLVGLLVGIAIDRGVIQSVEQPIGHFLEEFENDMRGTISIRELLQMRSGLAGQDAGFPLTNLQAMYYGDSPDARALSVPAVQPPGLVDEYNSVNTQLLLMIVERSLGGEFEELLSRHIWEPLELEPGYGWRTSPTGDAKGFCCVFATARTWASIGRLFLDAHEPQPSTPSIVSHAWLQEMMVPSHAGSNYGYQMYLGKTTNDLVPYAYFSGSPQQFLIVFPTAGIVAVRVGNEDPQFSLGDFLSAVLPLAQPLSSPDR